MNIPREKLIIFTAGHFLDKTESASDWFIAIDNFLTFHIQVPLTKSEIELLDDVWDEAWALMKMEGHNRATMREMAKVGRHDRKQREKK